MMLIAAARPARQSEPPRVPSTVSCEAMGARPLVVHEAHETTFIDAVSYSSWLTPTTRVGVSASLAGAEMITFLAPPSTCFMQPSVVVKAPVDSQTYSTPVSFHGISVGSRVADRETSRPLILRPVSVISQVPGKRPWTVSCSSRYFMYSGDIGELMCLSTNDSRSIAIRTTWRPMRPKPLTPILIGASGLVDMMGAARPSGAEAMASMMTECLSAHTPQNATSERRVTERCGP